MALDARQLVLLLALFTDVVMTECSAGCNSCSGSTCLKCESSYYLSNGFCSPCPKDCTSCNGYDYCTSCKPGKWGSDNQCQFTCSNNCYNKECHNDTGYCVQCKPGLYGPQCEHYCSICTDDLCDLRRCTHGCKQGYFEYKTETESICQICPTDCRNCNNVRTCQVCNDGFHLYQFHSNENMFVHCVSCSLGSNCLNYCAIQNCNKCEVHDGALVCADCPEGYRFNGKTCILNTTSCSQECSSYCNDDGICLGSCNAGWTGERCSGKCSDKCLTCDKSNSGICQQCKGDFHTVNCNTACNPSCITEKGKQRCRLVDGYCLNGCEHNFWGPDCDQSCSNGCIDNGLTSICERNNGTCKHGCKDGYSGDKCDITFTRKTTIVSKASTTTQKQVSTQCDCKENVVCKSNFVEGFFSGLGTSVVVAVITVTLFQIRRRYVAKKLKSQQDSKKTIEMPTYYNEDIRHTYETQEAATGTSNYEKLGNTRNTDNVYNDLETTVQ
ncbi:multiple epidermal growth factor-like domains protein 10 isoform X2 [Mercenaria mercenaria]|uniref:multiple epidermal growth factor-like domains protein 10 isoform X2 n=1 Tax=Mercenaria mercenaria TaxID=6596 RepID=UPI00234E59FB|nr:multiple epidermal growth factor-like domains protein 10 isoform X2 [Mercenaria mercenaria]